MGRVWLGGMHQHRNLVATLVLASSSAAAYQCGASDDILGVESPESLCVGESGTIVVRWESPTATRNQVRYASVDASTRPGLEVPTSSSTLLRGETAQLSVTCNVPGDYSVQVTASDGTTIYDGRLVQIRCTPCDGDAGLDGDAGATDGGTDGGVVVATPSEGVFDSVPGTEIVAPSWLDDIFGISSGISAVVAGEGVVIHDMSDGSVAHDLSSAGTSVVYRALPVRSRVAGEVRESIFAVGSGGFFDRQYRADMGIFGFAFLGAIGQNCTDVQAIADPSDPTLTTRFIMVNNTLGQVVSLEADGLDETELMSSTDIAVAGVDGSPVSCHANDDASRMVCNTSTDVFYWDGTDIALVGDGVGTALRLVHCGAGRCVLPDFAGDVLVFAWDGMTAPDLDGATRLPIFGAVSAEVHEDGRLAVPSSSAGELHVLTLDASLAVTEERVCVIDTPATAPHHAAWFPGTDFVVVNHGGDAAIESIDVTGCAVL